LKKAKLKNYLLSHSTHFSPYLIQQVIKHVPSYRKALLKEINRFPNTEEISVEHTPILGMYKLEELEQRISDRATELVNNRARIKNPKKNHVDWHQINQNTIDRSTPKYMNGLERKAEIDMQTRERKRKTID